MGFIIAKFKLISYYGFIITPLGSLRTDVPIEVGFPFVFYLAEFRWGPQYSHEEFYFLPFLLNIVFWYLLSCLIVWIYDKVKKKP